MRVRLQRILTVVFAGLAVLAACVAPAHAQLANSSWPMLGFDAKHTGQATLLGPLFSSGAPGAANVKSVAFNDKIKMFPVVGPGGIVYVGMGFQFCAINPDMTPVDAWNPLLPSGQRLHPSNNLGCVPTNADVSPAAAAVDGTTVQNSYVYFGDRDNTVYRLRGSDGARMWTYNHGHEGDVLASVVIGVDPNCASNCETIYAAFSQTTTGNGTIAALKNDPSANTPNPNGQPLLKWTGLPNGLFNVGQFATMSSPALTLDTDGKPLLYIGFADATVRAIKDNGTSAAIKWKQRIGATAIQASPVVGSDGTVYVGGYGGMYALDPAPTDPNANRVKWTFSTSPGLVDSTAAIASDGTLYFVSRNMNQRTVYSVDPAKMSQGQDKATNWKYGPITAALSPMGGFPVIGADEVVYVGMANGIYALQPTTGTVLWQFATTNGIISAPAIGTPAPPATPATPASGGTAVIYIGSLDRNVYQVSSNRIALSQNTPPGPLAIHVTPSTTVPSGTDLTFDASGSHDANGDPLFFSWDFGDGTTATGVTADHTYWSPSNTSFIVTLTADDGLAKTQKQVTINITGVGTTYFCDGFTRTAGPTLGGPTGSDLTCTSGIQGQALTWEEDSGSLSIGAGGKLINDLVKATHIATVDGFNGADEVVAVDFTSPNNSYAPRFGIILRFTDPNNYYLASRVTGGASVLRLSRVVGGVEKILGWVGLPNPTVNTPFRLRASAIGTTLTIKADTGQTLSVTDSTFAAGSAGVLFSWTTTNTVSLSADNFKACAGPPGSDCSAIQ